MSLDEVVRAIYPDHVISNTGLFGGALNNTNLVLEALVEQEMVKISESGGYVYVGGSDSKL